MGCQSAPTRGLPKQEPPADRLLTRCLDGAFWGSQVGAGHVVNETPLTDAPGASNLTKTDPTGVDTLSRLGVSDLQSVRFICSDQQS